MRPQRHRKLQRRVTAWPRKSEKHRAATFPFPRGCPKLVQTHPDSTAPRSSAIRDREHAQTWRSEVSTPVCAQADATLDRPQHEIYAAWYRLGLRSAGLWHEVLGLALIETRRVGFFPFVHLPAAFTEREWRCLGWLRAPREGSASPSPRASFKALDDMGGSGQARMMSEALVAQAVDRQVPGDLPP